MFWLNQGIYWLDFVSCTLAWGFCSCWRYAAWDHFWLHLKSSIKCGTFGTSEAMLDVVVKFQLTIPRFFSVAIEVWLKKYHLLKFNEKTSWDQGIDGNGTILVKKKRSNPLPLSRNASISHLAAPWTTMRSAIWWGVKQDVKVIWGKYHVYLVKCLT